MKLCPILYILCPTWIKFGPGDNKNLFSECMFCENRCSEKPDLPCWRTEISVLTVHSYCTAGKKFEKNRPVHDSIEGLCVL